MLWPSIKSPLPMFPDPCFSPHLALVPFEKLFKILFRGLKRKKKKRKKKIKLNCEAQENQNPLSSLILAIRNNATNQLVLHFRTFLILGWNFNLSLVNNFNSLVTVKSNVNMYFRSTDWKCCNSPNTINRKKDTLRHLVAQQEILQEFQSAEIIFNPNANQVVQILLIILFDA